MMTSEVRIAMKTKDISKNVAALRRPGWMRSLAMSAGLATSLTACAGGSQPVAKRPAEPTASIQDVDSLVRLGDYLRERNELGTAIALYQRAAAASDSAEQLIRLGQALAEVGADERAAGAFRRALAREPDNPDALFGLGKAYLALGQTDKAIQRLEELVSLGDGSDPARYAALGAALDIAGRHQQAIEVYQVGLDETPDDLDLKTNLALSYALNDRHVEAIDLMTEVSDSLEAERSHHRNLVLVLALAGQSRDAVATGLRLLGEKETQDVLAQASSARKLVDGAERARAIGAS
jgi:tetratricopeptide (TPR) repeat protein